MALALLAVAGMHAGYASACSAQSGPHTAALVELYRSARCSGCPPAERWLASLARRSGSAADLIPIVLHVDERNYGNDRRDLLAQRRLTPRQRLALLHPPQVLLQGREFPAWGEPAFDEAVSRINAGPSAARIRLEITALSRDALRVRALAELVAPSEAQDPALYLAAYERRAGHYVVREWQGPFAVTAGTRREERWLPLLPGVLPQGSGAVGFVQDRKSARVLQALALGAC